MLHKTNIATHEVNGAKKNCCRAHKVNFECVKSCVRDLPTRALELMKHGKAVNLWICRNGFYDKLVENLNIAFVWLAATADCSV